jgi:Family of unknown function (DUF5926)/SEC-C motif
VPAGPVRSSHMAKSSRSSSPTRQTRAVREVRGEVAVVPGREPCPCGSGRRYKACHGRQAARAADALVQRPFAGLASEGDWVALRDIVPAATAQLRLAGEHAGRQATLSTVLPLAASAMVRLDGAVFVGLQATAGSGDASRDVAAALLEALAAGPGTIVHAGSLPGPGPRLEDVIDPAVPLEVTVRDGFEYWIEGVVGEDRDPEVAASLERANAGVVPTVRLVGVEAAYWAGMPERSTLRWVLPHEEEPLLDALARLHVLGGLTLGEGTRFIGTFRAHGLLVPVWDLPVGARADDIEDPAAEFRARLDSALAASAPLTIAERHARAGLLTRQLTLR